MTATTETVSATRPDATSADAERPKAPRRGLRRLMRFNLLTLLVALLLVTLYFGVRQRFAVTPAENRAKRELTALHAGYTLGPAYPVWLQYALVQFGEDAQHVESVTFPPYIPHVNDVREAKRLSAEELAPLARLPRLRKVDFAGASFDDKGLAALRNLSELDELILSGTATGDEGIALLEGHPSLSVVRLDRTLTSDLSLKTLATLPNLTEVSLDDATTGEGVLWFAGALKLKQVDASFTTLRAEDVEPFGNRGIDLALAIPRSLPGDPSPDQESFWSETRRRGAPWVRAEGIHLTDPRYLAELEQTPSVCVVNVHDDDAIDPEALASLLAMPQILEIYLDSWGPAVPYAAIDAVVTQVRPADADPCIVYGNVAITGEELVRECAKARSAKRRPTSTIYAPYVVWDLRPEQIAALDELFPGTDVRVQPHAPVNPNYLVEQSYVLEGLSLVFVSIPMP